MLSAAQIFLGVGPAIYSNPILAGEAIASAPILGAEVITLADAYENVYRKRGILFRRSLDEYREGLKEGNDYKTSRAKASLAKHVTATSLKVWKQILAKIQKTGWATSGGLFATPQAKWKIVTNNFFKSLKNVSIIARRPGETLSFKPPWINFPPTPCDFDFLYDNIGQQVGYIGYHDEADKFILTDIRVYRPREGIGSAVLKWLAQRAANRGRRFVLKDVENPTINRIVIREKIFEGRPRHILKDGALNITGRPRKY
ncbi:MAG: hypothetical protein A2W61_07320 [Deltaproteobacteria bacterium RIFCSPLOWO2_01_44_7]|nr:MAG: hypothetical protein A2712_07975 [Deltaproteobacteria bacterium RIFCSPHIGHO2_01_FULL_43_49]OGQ14724.1 MAG: hypothetical protein A3D22_09025 [Deltaproteobacteria bacterium RIFCSPHIGHO2_02_FULL_44_53]OGQ28110.1 MAG: hypothetical protein A3D98_07735 [Deltaproteobacteria bacterium RIFCSPHIGHO2_12_FULL_44_21]OGQ31322.1 MAG: hypothetical protein A2979_07785 [Deltaproteobacteria bacterium RIFCSPLOWO2_01_FULL_45_74]OGQ40799.1 MAG: hypothetical protein A2W61_07320 [Deltaproteobacteria bacterium 